MNMRRLSNLPIALAMAAVTLLVTLLGLNAGRSAAYALPANDTGGPYSPTGNALAMAQALAEDASWVTASSFVTTPSPLATDVFTNPLTFFPTGSDANYVALSSGKVSDIPGLQSQTASTNFGGGHIRGNNEFDVTIWNVDLNVPVTANCLTLDFQFMSEEAIGSPFNEGFIAELDTDDWATNNLSITAPHNFAFGPGGNIISVNSPVGLNVTNTVGTRFNKGTARLTASTPITPGAHSLYLSIFDMGDNVVDSAVLLDKLVLYNAPGGSCATGTVTGHALTINTAGTGSGTVMTNPPGTMFPAGTVITLTAVPSATSVFAGWSGAITGLSNPVTLTMDADKVVTATFSLPIYTLGVIGTYDYVSNHPPMSIASGLTITSTPAGGAIDGAIVIIGSGFQTGDTLAATNSGGVTSSYNATTGVLTLSGTADVSVYQTVLGTVTFSTTSTNTTVRTVTYSLGTALPYGATGHFFEYVPSASITWANANTAASGRTYFGRTGYLATMNDAGENSFAATKIGGAGAWVGGSDAATEATWQWVTGPEAGTTFCIGNNPCVVQSGWYVNWNTGEPNDGGNEDYMQFLSGGTGKWNDLSGVASGTVAGYVVEYGGMAGDAPMTIQGNVTVTVSNATVLTVNTTGTGSGTVTPNPNQANYTPGTVVTLTAVPSATSVFAGWSGAINGATNPVTVTMDADKVVTATFDLSADLAVTENVLRTANAITYTIVARNLGPGASDGAVVSSTFPAEVINVTWTCISSGGAVCGGSGSGNSLADTLTTFPSGGVVTYTVQGTLGLSATGNNLVTITPPSGVVDPNLANNQAMYKVYRWLFPIIFNNASHP